MAGAAERARKLGGEAARLRDRAALARARGDEGLANSLLDVAKRQSRQAHRLRKEAKASGEIKTSVGGEGFDKRRKTAMRRANEARKAGNTRAAKAHEADAEMYSKLAVQAYREDGVRNRRVRKDEGNFAQEVADREAKKLAAARKREAKTAAKAAERMSPEARAARLERDAKRELWAKKRALWAARRAEQARRLRVQRSTQNNVFDQFVLSQQELARDRARLTREFRKQDEELDKRYGELYETPEDYEKKLDKLSKFGAARGIISILRQRAKDKKEKHEREMTFDPAYRAKEEAKQAKRDKTLIGRAKIALRGSAGRIADRVSASRVKIRQENADEEKAKKDLTDAKKAAKTLRANLASERKKLKVIRAAYSYQPTAAGHVASPAQARAAAAIKAQESKVQDVRTAAHLSAASDERRHAELTRVLQAKQAKYDAVKAAGPAASKIRRAELKEARNALRAHEEWSRTRAKSYREALNAEKEGLQQMRVAHAQEPSISGRAAGRAAIAEQASRVKSAREAVKENAAKGKAAKAKIAEVEAAREARHKGSLGYKLGAPKRAVQGLVSKANQRFQVALLTFKTKHGIDKPLLPWQRRTVMQKLFGSDKDYKGVTYHAKGLLGLGDAAVLGRRGQQGVHPEDHDVASKTPYSLHKGKKGGVFYIGPKGKKVYISHGGVFGFIKAFKSGLGGHRLLR